MAGDRLTLLIMDGLFAICRLDAASSIPSWATVCRFHSVTRTSDELSVVCDQDAVPEGIPCERGWSCLRVAGTLPLSAVGILASLVGPLAEAHISVFAISTFDTDYLLMKGTDLQTAIELLRGQGHEVAKT